jgi:hypothetical protein
MRKELSGTISIPDSEYNFLVIGELDDLIKSFILKRCKEEKDCIYEKYSEVIRKRLNNGNEITVLIKDNQIVVILFISTEKSFIDQINFTYIPENNEFMIIDGYTLSGYRKKGLYYLLFNHVNNHYFRKGYRYSVGWVLRRNRATIKAHLKLGFREIFQTVTEVNWLGVSRKIIKSRHLLLDEI